MNISEELPLNIGERIGLGRTAEVYALPENRVVKLFFDWCPAQWAAEEAEVARRCTELGLPAARFYEQVDLNGRAGLIYERISGPTGLQRFAQDPIKLNALLDSMAALQAGFHKAPGMGFPSLKENWLRPAIQKVEVLNQAEKTGIFQILDKLPEGDRLCHCDFHTDQVLFSARGPVILDWANARCGDPAADAARTILMFQVGEPLEASRVDRLLISLLRPIIYRLYLRAYLRHNPTVKKADILAWRVPIAAARLRENIPGEEKKLLTIIRKGLRSDSQVA